MFREPDRTMKGVAILCWVIGGAALVGSIALAFQGNLGGTIGLLVFGGGWTGFGFAARFIGATTQRLEARAGRAERAEDAEEAVDAEEAEEAPEAEWWLERPDWAEGKIRQDTTTGSRPWMIGASVMTGLGLAGALASQLLGWEPGGFGYLLLVVGGGMSIAGARARIRARKFGESVVECRTVPARVGERLRAIVQTGVPIEGEPRKRFHVRFTCEQRWTSGVGNDRETHRKTLWKHEETVAGTLSSAGPTFQVPLDLAIPDGLPSTTPLSSEDRTFWTLRVRSETAGVDYAAEFEVPVAGGRGAAFGRDSTA